jgi:mercuric ion transport protein
MTNRPLLRTGIIGTVIAAICCFTPILVILAGAVGLSAIVGWLDYVLLPALAVFIGITIYALVRRAKSSPASAAATDKT